MLFWRLGASLWLFRWIFRDPKVDVRFLFIGVAIPDLFDLTIGTLLLAQSLSRGELWFHSLLVPSVYMAVVLLATRRGRQRRRFMAVGVGWLFHLLLDGLWTGGDVFFWPFFGFEFLPGDMPFWQLAWERAMGDPVRWILEGIGLGYLVWLWFRSGMDEQERRVEFLKTGRIPQNVHHDA